MSSHLAPLILLCLCTCDSGRSTSSLGGNVLLPEPGEGEGEGEGKGEGDPFVPPLAQGEGEGEGEPAPPGLGQGEGEGEGEAPQEQPCARNSDCEEPLICTPQGICDVECVQERDCDRDLMCVEDRCVEVGEEGEGEVGAEGEVGEGGEVGEEGEGVEEPPPCPGGPGVPGVPADYGDVCARASACSCDLCFDEAPAGGDGVCSAHCQADGDCPGLDTCETIGNVRACVPNDVGDACRDPSQCNFGICLNDPADGGAVCTKNCDSRLECGQGFGCGMVVDQQGGDSWSCVPVGGRCGAAAGCSGSRCLPDAAGGAQGYCTNDCRTSADCDIGNVCCGIPGADGCPVGVCVRGACPAQCRGDADCPPGWGCFDVDHPDGGSRNICVNMACVGG